MNCQDAREFFSELLDSHVGLTERVQLEAHLRECEACQRELEALRLGERPRPAPWRPSFKLDFLSKTLEGLRLRERPRPAAWRPSFKLDFLSKALDGLRLRERPRPAAWRPSFKLDFLSKTLEGLHPADMVDRLRQRVFPRNRVIRRARARPVLYGKTLEALRPASSLSPHRSVHARGRIPWRSRLGIPRAAKALAVVRRIDIVAPLRRAVASLDPVVRRIPLVLGIARKSLGVARKTAFDVGGKALQVAQKTLGITRTVLELGRQTLSRAWSLAMLAWHHRGVLLRAQARHLRLTATVLLVSLGAIGLFRYRAELDVAVHRWAPSAPSSGNITPPTRMASTEPATRPEIPPVSLPATVVPAPPALDPPPAPRAPEWPRPEMPPRVTAPPARPKSSILPPEPVVPRRAPAPSPPVRDTRASRAEKRDASKSDRIETPPQKTKNGSAKPDMVASTAPRKDNPVATKAASPPRANGDSRPSLDVVGKLRVKSLSGAERDLAALLAKAGGTTVSRQRGEKIMVIEAVIPNPSYGKFTQGLTRIGSWQVEAGRSQLPDPVRVTVRLAE
jgi:outer membrane biosynthesis protein TonB